MDAVVAGMAGSYTHLCVRLSQTNSRGENTTSTPQHTRMFSEEVCVPYCRIGNEAAKIRANVIQARPTRAASSRLGVLHRTQTTKWDKRGQPRRRKLSLCECRQTESSRFPPCPHDCGNTSAWTEDIWWLSLIPLSSWYSWKVASTNGIFRRRIDPVRWGYR